MTEFDEFEDNLRLLVDALKGTVSTKLAEIVFMGLEKRGIAPWEFLNGASNYFDTRGWVQIGNQLEDAAMALREIYECSEVDTTDVEKPTI